MVWLKWRVLFKISRILQFMIYSSIKSQREHCSKLESKKKKTKENSELLCYFFFLNILSLNFRYFSAISFFFFFFSRKQTWSPPTKTKIPVNKENLTIYHISTKKRRTANFSFDSSCMKPKPSSNLK